MTKSHSPRQLTRWLSWRAARWALIAAVVPVLWACNERRLAVPAPEPQQVFNDIFQQSVNRKLDIVFMIDDSSSMEPLQVKLTNQFPVFMNELKKIPGGLPDVHIGVVSSSMGAGANSANIAHCTAPHEGNDQGVFQTRALGTTCNKAMLNTGQNFIINSNGNVNYTGDIADVFSCIAKLGQNGCGFEHQFESVLRALGADGGNAPAQNAGFLRSDAYLAIVLITNEDDCSAPPNSDLFNTTTGTLSDPLGPLQSYRCNRYGHLCGGQPPPNMVAAATPLDNCTSAEDGRLLRVKDVVAAMKGLKADPNKVLVAAIAGDPTPYVVDMYNSASLTGGENWPEVQHSCQVADGTYGDPAVRIKQWVDGFGANGVFMTICNQDFTDALQVIGKKIGQKIGSPCVTGVVLDTKGNKWTDGDANPPDCAVVDHKSTTDGVVNSTLSHCDNNTPGATECWTLAPGGTTCPADSFVIGFNRPGAPSTMDLNSTVSCSVRTCPIGQTIQADGTCK